ncbi:hypothetical protein SteCoe_20210 [Stentor coeruleus]|uniref:Uncharacterized protein n=1 Tax=Stentor coeruleus TaxID=5963 RepID=A0A1R2BSJ9_9CILI|nr:hypothetical protein SteCoe_20210 [Stentor coeruleus]
MRLETFIYQRALRYKYNIYKGIGWLPSVGLMAYWVLENGFKNVNAYVLNPPAPGVAKRQEGEDLED